MMRLGITNLIMRITDELMRIRHIRMGITDQKVLFQKCVSKGAFSKVRFSHSYAELRSGISNELMGISLAVMRISVQGTGITFEVMGISAGSHSYRNQVWTYENHQ